MSILSINELDNKVDRMVERIQILNLIKREFTTCMNGNLPLPVVLVDPDKEIDMQQFIAELGVDVRLVNMADCRANSYQQFVLQTVVPFAAGTIKGLLLDHIDCLPDIPDRDNYHNLLRAMMKCDIYQPLDGHEEIDFNQFCRIGMRCANLPAFTQFTRPYIIDCKSGMWIEEHYEQVIASYLSKPSSDLPLMLIFGQAPGGKNTMTDRCKKWLRETYRCADTIGENVGGIGLVNLDQYSNSNFQLVLFHRYVDQFNADALRYAVQLVREHHLPVVCLANAYEHEQNLGIDLSDFDVHCIE